MKTLRRFYLRLPFWTLLSLIALGPCDLPAGTLLEAGQATIWNYDDDGIERDAAWRRLDYDDSQWKSGRAPLGFGETGLTTQLNSGRWST